MQLLNLLTKVREDTHSTLTTKAQGNINQAIKITKSLTVNTNATEKYIHKLEQQMELQKQELQTLRDINEQAEKQEQKKFKIQSAVEKVLQTHTEKLERMTVAMENVTKEAQEAIKKALQEVEEKSKSQPTTTTSKSETISPGPTHRKTLIVKTAGQKMMTGEQILNTIDTQHLSVPAGTLDKIIRRKNHVEIRCKTEEARKGLQQTLQQHQILNRSLNFIKKTAPLQKMILIGVPEGYNNEYIKQTFLDTYNLTPDEINLFGNRNNKETNTNNWIILLPTPLAKYIIEEGGVLVGFKHCKLRPHTSIPRCRKCQSLSHSTTRCPESQQFCENCGGNHNHEHCKEPSSCINCKYHNKHNNTRFPTDHKASESKCHTYRFWYAEEREKLNNIFGLNNIQTDSRRNYMEPQQQQYDHYEHYYHQGRTQQQHNRGPYDGMERRLRY